MQLRECLGWYKWLRFHGPFYGKRSMIIPINKYIQKQPQEVFCKKRCSQKFTKFTGKHLCQSLRPATLLKKRLWHRYFPVNLVKFSKDTFFVEHLWTTASIYSQPYLEPSQTSAAVSNKHLIFSGKSTAKEMNLFFICTRKTFFYAFKKGF